MRQGATVDVWSQDTDAGADIFSVRTLHSLYTHLSTHTHSHTLEHTLKHAHTLFSFFFYALISALSLSNTFSVFSLFLADMMFTV